MKIEFDLDGDMEQYGPDIQMFVTLMLEKLQKNIHKGRWEHMPLGIAWMLLLGEIRELRKEMEQQHLDRHRILRECADVANFAMIMSSIALREK